MTISSFDDAVNKAAEGVGSEESKGVLEAIRAYTAELEKVENKIPEWTQSISTSVDNVNTKAKATSILGNESEDDDWWQKVKNVGQTIEDTWETLSPDSLRAWYQEGGEADVKELLDEVSALDGAIGQSKEQLQKIASYINTKATEKVEEIVKEKIEQNEAKEIGENGLFDDGVAANTNTAPEMQAAASLILGK